MATIQGVYVALFGRPADPAGLAYFNSVTKNGADLNGIGNLAGQKEYTDRFTGLNNAQVINTIYQSLFGRDADAAGLEYFAGQLNAGKLTINNIAIAILDGAQGNDKTIVTNKVAAADLFTQALDTAVEVASYSGTAAADAARAFIKGVSTTATTKAAVDASITALVTTGAAGNTITLTDKADTLSLSAGVKGANDAAAVVATDRADVINATGATWQTASASTSDTIDAGLGVDTFNLTEAVTATVQEGKLKNVEIINATIAAGANNAAGTAATLTVSEATQLTQVWNNASKGALTVDGIALTTTVGVKGDIAANAATFTFAEATGSSDVATLALDSATNSKGGAVSVANIETLNVSNLNTSNIVDLTIANAKTVNVTGSGDLTLATTGTQVVETFNASAYTGKLTVNLGAQNALKTATGGTGVDKFTVDTVHTNDITINGGAGSDTLKVVAGDDNSSAKTITLTGGADADIFEIGRDVANIGTVDATTTNADFVKSLITISDFNGSADAIKFTGTAVAGTSPRDIILGAEQAEISSSANLLAATKVAASFTEATKFSVFSYGGDSYLFANNGGATLGTEDTLVKVTGIADVASFTAANFAA